MISVGARRWQRSARRRCGAAGPCGVAGGGSDPPSLSGCWRLRLPCRESSVATELVLLRVFGWGGAAADQGLGWTRCVVVWGCGGELTMGLLFIHIPAVHQEQKGDSGTGSRVPRAVQVGAWHGGDKG